MCRQLDMAKTIAIALIFMRMSRFIAQHIGCCFFVNVEASASTFLGWALRTPSGGEGLPKVCCRRTSRFGHLCSQCSTANASSLHSGHVGPAAALTLALRWPTSIYDNDRNSKTYRWRIWWVKLSVLSQDTEEICGCTKSTWCSSSGISALRRVNVMGFTDKFLKGPLPRDTPVGFDS